MDETQTTRTTCPYCGVGCGVLATRHQNGVVTVAGDPEHPANFGRLCSKGTALGETLALEGRLLHPEIAGKRASWDEALDLVARRFSESIREHGPDTVAFYVSGQLLTEDYYVANKLMKGYFGTANIDTNSRLCMASSVAGHRRAFGSDTVPGCYEDLELADLVVLVGSNLAWCHPVLFQRLLAAREKRGTKIVVIDPRRTVTADAADLHLAIRPDGDVALFKGLEAHLRRSGFVDEAYGRFLTETPPDAQEAAPDLDRIASETGIQPAELGAFFALFGSTERVVTVYSQGVNQSVCGTDKVTAILNCHLLTGRIGRPGMGPFSVTGQPNAMGGREVGGLANMLAAHMDIEDGAARERVQRFWDSPAIATRPGLKAVELFEAVSSGQIKALWIMGTNPAVSMPDADRIEEGLRRCPFVVVSDVVRETDTTRFAHVLLPAAAWGEKDGAVTNSERRISRQRPFLPLPGEARPDWRIIADVASRMGFSGFDYAGPAAIFAEHAALSGFENHGTRDFDISAQASLDADGYDRLEPFQWPQATGQASGTPRLFADGRFFTASGKARLVATRSPPASELADGIFRINTGRIRDQWHTMTRTGTVPRLMGQFGEPFCDIHPSDAERIGIASAALVRVEGAGRTVLRARITDAQRPGEVFVPMHWTARFSGRARINALVPPAVDPFSGQPGLKAGRGAVSRFEPGWHGYAVSVRRPSPGNLDYWALSPVEHGHALECAWHTAPADWLAHCASLLAVSAEAEWVALHEADGVRFAAFTGNRLEAVFFASRAPVVASRQFLAASLGETHAGALRLRVLAGRSGGGERDDGPLLCACNAVGRGAVAAAVAAGARTLASVGDACGAGTGCGSCRPDITAILEAHAFHPLPQVPATAMEVSARATTEN